jgi:hypothetical protein
MQSIRPHHSFPSIEKNIGILGHHLCILLRYLPPPTVIIKNPSICIVIASSCVVTCVQPSFVDYHSIQLISTVLILLRPQNFSINNKWHFNFIVSFLGLCESFEANDQYLARFIDRHTLLGHLILSTSLTVHSIGAFHYLRSRKSLEALPQSRLLRG